VTVVSAPGTFSWGRPVSTAAVAARLAGSLAAAFGYQGGDTMVGLVAPARRAGLFLQSGSVPSLTPDGAALLDAAVCWTAGLGAAP
jgi:hypothetical protein